MIRLENVAYESVAGTVRNVNFHLKEGCAAVLLGPHKSGKSDFLKVCMGLHPVLEGKVFLMGREITPGEPPEEYGKMNGIGFLTQIPTLLDNLTVEGNISLPMAFHSGKDREEIHELVKPIIEQYGLTKVADSFPNQISHDDAKVAQLARAAALRPRLLFLDEPTAGDLDPGGFLRVIGFIKNSMAGGVTILATTCSPSLACTEGLEPYLLAGTSFMAGAEVAESRDPMIIEFIEQLKEYTKRQSKETVRFLQSLTVSG